MPKIPLIPSVVLPICSYSLTSIIVFQENDKKKSTPNIIWKVYITFYIESAF